MATNILMPALSPTMTEGTLARWLKKEGDQVKAGDIIAEIETDKATMEVEAVDEGILGKILVADGTAGVQVNATIGVLVEEGESADAAPAAAPAPASAPKAEANQSPSQGAAQEGIKVDGGKVAGAAEQPITPPAPAETQALNPQPIPPKANGHDGGDRVFVSPLAKRMAAQSNLDLSGITGSGPGGRIVKSDIEAALNKPGGAKPAPAPAAATPAAAPAAPA
ncbi:MAG: biotin/lipoyl-binding protein, partial [Acetobacteraceae bacterium]